MAAEKQLLNLAFEDIAGVKQVEIYSAIGQVVRCGEVRTKHLVIDLSNCNSGYYIVRVIKQDKILSSPLVISQ